MNRYWIGIEWDFETEGGVNNALEYFSDDYPLRNWDQFLRKYMTFRARKGSYCWALYLQDPEVIDEMCKISETEWQKSQPPPLLGWTAEMDRLTDLGDQLIATRAQGKFKPYPRPRIPAAEARKTRIMSKQDDLIAASRNKNKERRGI